MSDQILTSPTKRFALAAALLTCNACAAARVQMPAPPNYGVPAASEENNVTFALNSFTVSGQTENDSEAAIQNLREAFLDHIDATSSFVKIVDTKTGRGLPFTRNHAVFVDVNIDLDNTRKTNWFFAFPAAYPMTGIWPLVPTHGEVKVRISARAKSMTGKTLWSKNVQHKSDFDIVIYGWYVTEPIENAFKKATNAAVHDLISDLSNNVTKFAKLIGANKTAVAQNKPTKEKPPISIQVRGTTKAIPVAKRPVVAVFDIEDTRLGAESLSGNEKSDVTNYLTSLLAGTKRFTTVPRSDLRKVLEKQKAESFKTCYDESCQIEIGKEVAAQKSLAAKLNRLGNNCIVTLTLFDLRKSITEDSVNHRGGCSMDNLTTAFEKLVPTLGTNN